MKSLIKYIIIFVLMIVFIIMNRDSNISSFELNKIIVVLYSVWLLFEIKE